MEGTGETNTIMQRLNSSYGQSSPVFPKPHNNIEIPGFSGSQIGVSTRQLSPNFNPENCKRPGIPPSHPNNPCSLLNSQIMSSRSVSRQLGSQNLSPVPSHSRSLSQPTFFSLDCLPPLSPSPYRESSASSLSDPISQDVSMEDSVVNSHAPSLTSPGAGLPPRRGHRRSNSDIPLGFSAMIQSSPQLIPVSSRGNFDHFVPGRENLMVDKPVQLMKQCDTKSHSEGKGNKKPEVDMADDLFNAYMNLENIDKMNSSVTEDKDLDSRASGSKTNGGESSDNEVESCVNTNISGFHGSVPSSLKREGGKRSATGDIVPPSRHHRSVSMDSYMGSLNFYSEPPKLPPMGTSVSQHSPSDSMVGNSSKFNMEFGSGEFSGAELKKIMENEKLAEIALSDPKRAQRILANRQSAARSKERKMRYISELEHKVQTLQTEATTLSAQLTKLQRDSVGLSSENNELKFRVQAMEQQAQLKDALNEALTGELQRLKLVAAELGGEAHLSSCMAQQLSINQQHMFQMQHHEPNHHSLYQLQQRPQNKESRPEQKNGEEAKPEPKQ